MILVWRGWGILCVLIPGGLIVLAEAVAGERLFQQYTGLFWAIVLLVSAGILWLLGQRLNHAPGRVLVDPQTGEQVVLRKTHSFFFVRYGVLGHRVRGVWRSGARRHTGFCRGALRQLDRHVDSAPVCCRPSGLVNTRRAARRQLGDSTTAPTPTRNAES